MKLSDELLFDYLVFKNVNEFCITGNNNRTNADGDGHQDHSDVIVLSDTPSSSTNRLNPVLKVLLQGSLSNRNVTNVVRNQQKAHLLLLTFTVQELEGFLGQIEFNTQQDEIEEISLDRRFGQKLSRNEVESILYLLSDLQDSLKMFSNTMDSDSIRQTTRKCLLDCLILIYLNSVRIYSGVDKALQNLVDFVNKDSVSGEQDFIEVSDMEIKAKEQSQTVHGFIMDMKECISTLSTCFEIPQEIKAALASDDPKFLFDTWLKDQRPSVREHVLEHMSENRLTDSRKEELDRLVEDSPHMSEIEASCSVARNHSHGPSQRNRRRSSFSPQKRETSAVSTLSRKLQHFDTTECHRKMRRVDAQMEKYKSKMPPSHRSARLGAWLPEEEKAFIEATLKKGIGNWAAIRTSLRTLRSNQQLKDKWRNLKQHDIQEVAKMAGLKYPP